MEDVGGSEATAGGSSGVLCADDDHLLMVLGLSPDDAAQQAPQQAAMPDRPPLEAHMLAAQGNERLSHSAAGDDAPTSEVWKPNPLELQNSRHTVLAGTNAFFSKGPRGGLQARAQVIVERFRLMALLKVLSGNRFFEFSETSQAPRCIIDKRELYEMCYLLTDGMFLAEYSPRFMGSFFQVLQVYLDSGGTDVTPVRCKKTAAAGQRRVRLYDFIGADPRSVPDQVRLFLPGKFGEGLASCTATFVFPSSGRIELTNQWAQVVTAAWAGLLERVQVVGTVFVLTYNSAAVKLAGPGRSVLFDLPFGGGDLCRVTALARIEAAVLAAAAEQAKLHKRPGRYTERLPPAQTSSLVLQCCICEKIHQDYQTVFQMKRCAHLLCRECSRDYVTEYTKRALPLAAAAAGGVAALPCAHHDCDVEFDKSTAVGELVGDAVFATFCDLMTAAAPATTNKRNNAADDSPSLTVDDDADSELDFAEAAPPLRKRARISLS